jgi:hypothetical protein
VTVRFIDVATAVVLGLLIVMNIASMRAIRRELRQARLLQQQMESDHRLLVRSVIEVRNRLAPKPYGEDDLVGAEGLDDSGE